MAPWLLGAVQMLEVIAAQWKHASGLCRGIRLVRSNYYTVEHIALRPQAITLMLSIHDTTLN